MLLCHTGIKNLLASQFHKWFDLIELRQIMNRAGGFSLENWAVYYNITVCISWIWMEKIATELVFVVFDYTILLQLYVTTCDISYLHCWSWRLLFFCFKKTCQPRQIINLMPFAKSLIEKSFMMTWCLPTLCLIDLRCKTLICWEKISVVAIASY